MNGATFKSVARDIKKLQLEVSSRFSRVEVYAARSECEKIEKIQQLTEKFGMKNGWLYLISRYKYTKVASNTKRRNANIKKYMSCLEAEKESGGKSS